MRHNPNRRQKRRKMDLEDLYPQNASHMKSADLDGQERRVKIVKVGSIHFDGEPKPKALLELSNGQGVALGKALVCNVTNARIIGTAYGETKIERAWIDKPLVLYPTSTPMGPGIGVRIPAPERASEPERSEQGGEASDSIPF
jgi:hypothetical protein